LLVKYVPQNMKAIYKYSVDLDVSKTVLCPFVLAVNKAVQLIVFDAQKSPKISRSDIDGVYDTIVQNMNSTVAELKTMVEQERVAEEQERLRKIQVRYINCILQVNESSFCCCIHFFV